jgi:hypothetical protein
MDHNIHFVDEMPPPIGCASIPFDGIRASRARKDKDLVTIRKKGLGQSGSEQSRAARDHDVHFYAPAMIRSWAYSLN